VRRGGGNRREQGRGQEGKMGEGRQGKGREGEGKGRKERKERGSNVAPPVKIP
jgi:hypothetical protein